MQKNWGDKSHRVIVALYTGVQSRKSQAKSFLLAVS